MKLNFTRTAHGAYHATTSGGTRYLIEPQVSGDTARYQMSRAGVVLSHNWRSIDAAIADAQRVEDGPTISPPLGPAVVPVSVGSLTA